MRISDWSSDVCSSDLLQMIFQDPISSLNPRRRVRDIIAEPLKIWGVGSESERKAQGDEVLEAVGSDPSVAGDKRPHEFSGGQCQRISIARALVLDPKLVICDEPVSALDVSVQAQILNLLEDMKARYGLTLIFIAHDLAVVKNISDRVAVMYLGKICEVGRPDDIYGQPAHPYTDALLRAIPVPDPTTAPVPSGLLTGDPPSPPAPRYPCPLLRGSPCPGPLAPPVPSGLLPGGLLSPLAPLSCGRFLTRCPRAQVRCALEEPQIREVADGQFGACHFPLIGEEAPEVSTPVMVGTSG